ncbi:MAG: acetyl-CoA carboxylase biotin carboxyl carrier protein [Alphaproteobacteria bacterium]|nr:acetyl-CoA carboxylase biotin carboxyl carrier protein [Alphaproteobacteria bacterium]
MTQIDGDLVKQLAGILNETGLTEIEYDTGSLKIRVAKSVYQTAVMAAPMPAMGHAVVAAAAAAAPSDAANHPGCIKSPMVGVAYLSPEPGKPPFVKVGDQVAEGATLLLIEAMKTYNPVKAPKGGRVAQIIVADTSPVEFGEPLIVIE